MDVLTVVGERELDVHPLPGIPAAFGRALPDAEVIGFGDADAEENRIELRNRGQQRVLSAAHEIASLDERDPDKTADRRGDARVAQIERRFLDGGFRGLNLRARRVLLRPRIVELLLADCLFGGERGVARHVVVGFGEPRLRGRLLGLRRRENRFERLPVDGVEQRPLLHEGPLAEVHGIEEALDAGANLHVLKALGLPDQVEVRRDVPLDDFGHVDLGRGRRHGRRLLAGHVQRRRYGSRGEDRSSCVSAHAHVLLSVPARKRSNLTTHIALCGAVTSAGSRVRGARRVPTHSSSATSRTLSPCSVTPEGLRTIGGALNRPSNRWIEARVMRTHARR